VTALINVSRRGFLHGIVAGGAFLIASRVVSDLAWAETGPATRADAAPLRASVYLGIEADGTVVIVTHRSEMGTGIRTTLPMVAADELDADWSRVRIEQALADSRYGDQNTDGSRSMRDFYDAFRRAGAAARSMLISAAAAQWGVPPAQVIARDHRIVHEATDRSGGFGEFVAAAGRLPIPAPEQLQFKPRTAWALVGQDHSPPYDQMDILTGKAQFGNDVVRDGMVFATIEHPPVVGGRVKHVDEGEALKVRGVTQTITLDPLTLPWRFKPLGGVAVIGGSTWAVFQGRKRLKIEWEDGVYGAFDSVGFKQELLETVHRPGVVVRNHGDVDAEFAKDGAVVEAMYYTPLAAHAAMEPPAAVAEFVDGKVTIWAPTQNPQGLQDNVAQALGIEKKDVICHVTLLGGGFGRKSFPDWAVEAAVLSKKVGKPVKVVWTREDDLKCDYYHSSAAIYHKAAVNSRGKPTAWLARSAFPPIGSMNDPNATSGGAGAMGQGFSDVPFDVPHIRVENGPAKASVRIGWFRSVANNYHVFAVQSFVDELAAAASRDRVEFMLDILGADRLIDLKSQGVNYPNYGQPIEKHPLDTRRLRRVIELAAERSGWASKKSGNGRRGLGIAAHRSFNSYMATVVEVEVDSRGVVRVPRVDQVIDAGVIVNPDRVRAQCEGAAVMGVGLAMFGEITAGAGRIEQRNFNDFQVARMNTAPLATHVHLIDSDAPPTGVGETCMPTVAPALTNAIFAATGKRVRELPISRTKLV
jgi:isoquinoline 1-oxidoreductase beta subunit